MKEYMAPERKVWLNWSLLMRQAMTKTAPVMVKGTGNVVELVMLSTTVLFKDRQWVPLLEYEEGQAEMQAVLR